MSALGHFLEAEGLPTTQISLVRMHTEVIQPPRALWVPFELGRPFGTPGEAAFQRRVISAALALFERASGPVLEDFPEDAPGEAPSDTEGWSCPVALGAPPAADAEVGSLEAALLQEFHKLRPWYDVACQARDGRTTVGASQMAIDDLVPFVAGFLDSPWPDNPRDDIPIGDAFKYATEDLKGVYLEAAAAQPGRKAGIAELDDWFWQETALAQVYIALRSSLKDCDDQLLSQISARNLIPGAVLEKLSAAAN